MFRFSAPLKNTLHFSALLKSTGTNECLVLMLRFSAPLKNTGTNECLVLMLCFSAPLKNTLHFSAPLKIQEQMSA